MTDSQKNTLGEVNGKWLLAFKMAMVFITIVLPLNVLMMAWTTTQLIGVQIRLAVLESTVARRIVAGDKLDERVISIEGKIIALEGRLPLRAPAEP